VTITPRFLIRSAGSCAVLAGALFVLVQFIHPHEDVASVTTTAWAVTHVLTLAMSVFALIGITGMYLHQVTAAGQMGLVGYVLFAACFLLLVAGTWVEAFVLPPVADDAPEFVGDVVAIPVGGTIAGEVGFLDTGGQILGVAYLLGGVLFGIALFRAAVLARWAALTLAAGTALTLLLPLLPHILGRMTAVPVGLGLAGLGVSLWRESGSRRGPVLGSPNSVSAVPQ
jgi:hypothetical protein